MAEKSRFFDSTAEDRRLYSAADFAEYFATLVVSGVFAEELDRLQVVGHGTELKTIVKPGKAFVQGYFYVNDSDLELTHANPDPTYDRIDRVVLRLDKSTAVRKLYAAVLTGTPAADPQPPALTRAGDIYEIALAQVRLVAGRSYIDSSQVTDEREYARYQAKPAWYPQGRVPGEAWMYSIFKSQLTAEEVQGIEANPDLMAIINNSEVTPSALLEKLKTVDGPGSELNADKLDGMDASQFLRLVWDSGVVSIGTGPIVLSHNLGYVPRAAILMARDSNDNTWDLSFWWYYYHNGDYTGYAAWHSLSATTITVVVRNNFRNPSPSYNAVRLLLLN